MALNDAIFTALRAYAGSINDKMYAYFTAVGNGLLSGGGVPGVKSTGTLAQSNTASSVTGTATETPLATIQIPANTVIAGGTLRVTMVWSVTNSVNNKTLKATIGGSTFYNTVVTTVAAVRSMAEFRARTTTSEILFNPGFITTYGSTTVANTIAAVDMTAAQTLTITGTLANTGETITLEGYTVEILNP